jgi:hypothetical protein
MTKRKNIIIIIIILLPILFFGLSGFHFSKHYFIGHNISIEKQDEPANDFPICVENFIRK